MLKFFYKAKEGPSKIIEGMVEAQSEEKAIHQILEQGLVPLDLSIVSSPTENKSNQNSKYRRKRIISKDVVEFTRQMSDLIEASVPLVRSLEIVSRQVSSENLQNIVQDMYVSVRDGGAFSQALKKYPRVFSVLYVNLVKTGEVSGQLDIVLSRLARFLEKEHETRNKVNASLAYPAVILVVGILTVFVLLSFVVPKISVVFEDFGQTLPWPTVVLQAVSSFFSQFWWAIILVVGGIGYYLSQWVQTSVGKLWFDKKKLKLPIIGNFIRTVEVSRFAQTLGTLVESGVDITTAFQSVWAVVENEVLRLEIKKAAEDIAGGLSIKKALDKCAFFPEAAANMISVGEETGKLDRGLFKIADSLERESDQMVKTIIALLGPLALVIIVSIVGFVVIAMLLPIFQMNLLIE